MRCDRFDIGISHRPCLVEKRPFLDPIASREMVRDGVVMSNR
jgi:hypothetical protein